MPIELSPRDDESVQTPSHVRRLSFNPKPIRRWTGTDFLDIGRARSICIRADRNCRDAAIGEGWC